MKNILKNISIIIGFIISYTLFIHIIGPHADTCNNGDFSSYTASIILSILTFIIFLIFILIGFYKNPNITIFFIFLICSIPHKFTFYIYIITIPHYIFQKYIKGFQNNYIFILFGIVHTIIILFLIFFTISVLLTLLKKNKKNKIKE